jgi:hypothetical protein
MEWVRLKSRVFTAARYLEKQRLLYLEFALAPSIATSNSRRINMATFWADSHGRYLNRRILGRFREERLRPPRMQG